MARGLAWSDAARMRTALSLVVVLVGLGAVTLVHADEDAGTPLPGCSKTPTRDEVTELRVLSEKVRALAVQTAPFDSLETLDANRTVIFNVRESDRKIRCAYPVLPSKDKADAETFVTKADKWADGWEASVNAEESARTNTIVPLCQAIWLRDNAKAEIAREKANPSGVRDLRALHSAGQAQQAAEDQIRALTPQYVAFRKHPFKSWQSEGACVVAARP